MHDNITPVADCRAAKRAIVALYVPWSIYAVRAVEHLLSLQAQLRQELDANVFIVDEEDPATREWLASFGLPELTESPKGDGTYLWLEEGMLADSQLRTSVESPSAVLMRSHILWGGQIDRSIQPEDVIGKRIARILQTAWEHTDDYSKCNFYVQLDDGTLFNAQFFGKLALVDQDSTLASMMIEIEVDTDYPAFYSSDGFSGIGAPIQRVFVYGKEHGAESMLFILLATGHWLMTELEEGCVQLYLIENREFVEEHPQMTVYDYWTREPFAI